jgi:arylsulfatase A
MKRNVLLSHHSADRPAVDAMALRLRQEPGTVCPDLVDMTDLLPTICEAAGVTVPQTLPIDGRSFLPQVRGENGQPRDGIYSYWVPLRASQTKNVGSRGAVEQAFDQRFKLYSTGKFFDLDHDEQENSPQRVAELQGAAADAAPKKKNKKKQ